MAFGICIKISCVFCALHTKYALHIQFYIFFRFFFSQITVAIIGRFWRSRALSTLIDSKSTKTYTSFGVGTPQLKKYEFLKNPPIQPMQRFSFQICWRVVPLHLYYFNPNRYWWSNGCLKIVHEIVNWLTRCDFLFNLVVVTCFFLLSLLSFPFPASILDHFACIFLYRNFIFFSSVFLV